MKKSFWEETVIRKQYPILKSDIICDTLIVGGGISGITLAYLLSKEGKKGILVESDRLASKATANTTAKITIQHNLIYNKLIKKTNKKNAKAYYEANKLGLNLIEKIIADEEIDCDFKNVSSHVFVRSKKERELLVDEFRAYQELGIKSEFNDNIIYSLSIPNQGQFHPLKYSLNLVNRIQNLEKFKIFEKSRVVDILNDQHIAIMENGNTITYHNIVIATNYPIFSFRKGMIFRIYQKRSYLGIYKDYKSSLLPKNDDMYISYNEPIYSKRNYQNKTLVGGFSHRVGTHPTYYKDFLVHNKNIDSFWYTQDSCTIDNIPIAGKVSDNMYVMTGFNKWGMTSSGFCASLIKDILTSRNEVSEDIKKLVSPSRINFRASYKDFLVHLFYLMKGYTINNLKQLSNKEKQYCTHLGCPLTYNKDTDTFDCLCHGSCFNDQGDIVHSPAVKRIKKD